MQTVFIVPNMWGKWKGLLSDQQGQLNVKGNLAVYAKKTTKILLI